MFFPKKTGSSIQNWIVWTHQILWYNQCGISTLVFSRWDNLKLLTWVPYVLFFVWYRFDQKLSEHYEKYCHLEDVDIFRLWCLCGLNICAGQLVVLVTVFGELVAPRLWNLLTRSAQLSQLSSSSKLLSHFCADWPLVVDLVLPASQTSRSKSSSAPTPGSLAIAGVVEGFQSCLSFRLAWIDSDISSSFRKEFE